MKKFISTLLCIVFVAALMPAQIAKADSDVMSVANQVKVPILNEQTYNNKKLMNKYTRDMSDWWATDLTLTAGMLFKRCDVDNAYYQYWGSINEAVETMGMAYVSTFRGQRITDFGQRVLSLNTALQTIPYFPNWKRQVSL